MRIAVITDEKIPKSLHGFKISAFPWDSSKIASLNLRDYDGVVFDLDTYNSLDTLSDPKKLESEIITPKVVYDILKTSPSFLIVIGDPSTIIRRESFLGALGFTGKQISGSGTSHSLTEVGTKSIFKEYLGEVRRYGYSYERNFGTSAEVKERVTIGKFDSFTTLPVPLMATKSGYYTAFMIQGKAWEKGYNNQEYDKYYIFESMPVFLPSHPKGSRYAIDMLLRLQSDSEAANDSPSWIEDISVYGQKDLDDQILAKQEVINELINGRDDLSTQRDTLRKILELLYLSEKPLESALKKAFTDYGYIVGEPESSNHVEFYLSDGSLEFVVEVKSTMKEHFNKEGLRQVVEWKDNEALESGKEFKPLLILSNQYTKPIAERNEDVLDENLIAFAQSRNIAIITVPILYNALQLISEDKITKDNLLSTLFRFSGLIKLEDIHTEKKVVVGVEKDEVV